MRMTWGILCAAAVSFAWVGCANQSGSTQSSSTMAGSESTSSSGGGGGETSSTDANAMNPERQDAIERTFQRKTGELQQCWANEYEKTHDRKLELDLTIGMDIAANGTTSNVRILKRSTNNNDIESCVTQAIAQWSFPEGQATVPYMRTVHLGAQF